MASNSVSREVVAKLDDGAEFEDIRELVAGSRGRKVYDEGDTELGIWSVGMVQGLINDVPTVGDLVDRIVTEAGDLVRKRLGNLVAS